MSFKGCQDYHSKTKESIEIKEFVETTINEIRDGIIEAKDHQFRVSGENAIIAPGSINNHGLSQDRGLLRILAFEEFVI